MSLDLTSSNITNRGLKVTASGFTNVRKHWVFAVAAMASIAATITPFGGGSPLDTGSLTINPVVSGGIIAPGAGFSGATDQPDQVGAGPYSSQKIIMRWGTVPYQTFTGTFDITIYAFHINGVDRIEFIANGGTPLAVNQTTLDLTTGLYAYTATLRASDFADGALEVRAVGYPVQGVPRVMQGKIGETFDMVHGNGESSLVMNANHGGTLPTTEVYVKLVADGGDDSTGTGASGSPFATVLKAAQYIHDTNGGEAGGGIIYLYDGEHEMQSRTGTLPVTTSRWLVARCWPGRAKANVKVKAAAGDSSGLGVKLFALDGVTQTGAFRFADVRINNGQQVAFWANDVSASGTDRFTDGCPWGITANVGYNLGYFTSCSIDTMDDGWNGAAMCYNCTVANTAAGAFRNVGLVVGCTVDTIDTTGEPVPGQIHPDVYQHSLETSNAIVYGVMTTSVAFIRTVTSGGQESHDLAMIDCNWDGSSPYVWEFNDLNQNVYVRNCTFSPGFSSYAEWDPQDVVFESCTFLGGPPPAGVVIR